MSNVALWQFTLDLIPASAARVGGVDAIRLSREQLDAVQIELSVEEASHLFGWLDGLLPEKAPWSENLRIWGDEKADDVQVFFERGEIEFVQFRINVADPALTFVSGICAIAQNLDCALASRDGAIIRPTTEAVVREVLQSPAAQFVKDPQAFIEAAILRDADDRF